MEKERLCLWLKETTCCKPSLLVAPSLVEVEIVGLLHLGEVELVLACIPLGKVDCGCIASVEVVLVERGVRYSRLYKSSSVEVLGGQDSGLEILLGEGGDVELGARTSKHIIVFAFDPLTLYTLFILC